MSCQGKAFPDSKFDIPSNFRDLINCYKINDTLIFKSSTNVIDSFVISAIDSVTINKKSIFTSPANGKSISIYYKSFSFENKKDSLNSKDFVFVSVSKDPYNETTQYYYSFKESQCFKSELPKLKLDTIDLNGLKITHYYKIDNCNHNAQFPNSIKVCYSTIEKGLVSFKTGNDITWTRLN